MFKDSKRLTATDTLIGQGTLAEGTIHSEANIRIEGEFRGDILSTGEVIIGEYGIVRATINAQTITIAGQVHGDISSNGRVIITSSGQLNGNATVNTIVIQDGGQFNGQCSMQSSNKLQSAGVEQLPSPASKQEAQGGKQKARQAG